MYYLPHLKTGGSCLVLHSFQRTLHKFDYHHVIGEWLMNYTLVSPYEIVNVIIGEKH